jgi:hypothetical protein
MRYGILSFLPYLFYYFPIFHFSLSPNLVPSLFIYLFFLSFLLAFFLSLSCHRRGVNGVCSEEIFEYIKKKWTKRHGLQVSTETTDPYTR